MIFTKTQIGQLGKMSSHGKAMASAICALCAARAGYRASVRQWDGAGVG